jgi:hypothetical protein
MSSSTRLPRSAATVNINLIRGMFYSFFENLEVCGSYRMGNPTIGDVDMVILPSDNLAFLDHLDSLVARDLVKRGTQAGGSQSWGEKKRLIHFRGLNFDVAIANEHNFGYLQWLRTGPAEANTLLMGFLSKHNSRVRMDDGFLWHVTYNANYISSRERKAANGKQAYHKLGRLSIPDEETFFKVLGLPHLAPKDRSEFMYRRYMSKALPSVPHELLMTYYLTEEQKEDLANSGIKQKSLL